MENALPVETPARTRRIALIGSAPSSVRTAPYEDPSWEIWGCSSGACDFVRRVDVWFELHSFSTRDLPRDYMTPDYVTWMRNLGKPIQVIEPVPQLPQSVAFPFEDLLKKYGPYFFTSSIAWMFAAALEQNPAEIGLWGVDMASNDERYTHQRSSCHHFIELARTRGIKVTVPQTSDLLQPPAPYGYVMTSPMYNKLMTRKAELEARINAASAKYEDARNEWNFCKGALDDVEYTLQTWTS